MRRRNRRKKQKGMIMFSVVCLMFVMVTAYSAFSTTLTIGAKGNVVDRGRTIQSWAWRAGDTSWGTTDFHASPYRENIVSATFLDSAKVPDNAVDSWDVSVSKDGGVMAYVTESSLETGKYDLFIGAKDGVIANENSNGLFDSFSSLVSINFRDNFDTSNVTNMGGMFAKCYRLKNLDLSSFNTTLVTDMNGMFKCMTDIEMLDLSSFDTRNVTTMNSMFSTWDGQRRHSSSLKSINFGDRFVTSNVESMNSMFYGLNSLTDLDLSLFDTSSVTDMYHTFTYCSSLTTLNLCSFNTAKVTNMYEIFGYTTNLTKVKVGPNWTMNNVTNSTNMFYNSGVSSVIIGEC